MHKIDVKDRMKSLHFKMKNVYNLDKKKGAASDVFKFFMKRFGKDIDWKYTFQNINPIHFFYIKLICVRFI